jgi:adenylosuccinate synthase
MKRAIITVGLGFGDEGKGATVDYLTRQYGADLVVRYCGGSQAGHNVQLPDGRRHTFSQFGAGTLVPASGRPRTYLGPNVILDPPALRREAQHLAELGVADPIGLVSAHPRCLVTTPWLKLLNQLRELSRGEARHGSCGQGIGEARRYWLRHGEDSVFVSDLAAIHVLRRKLELQRQRILLELQEFLDRIPSHSLRELEVWALSAEAVARDLYEAAGEGIRIDEEVPDYHTAIFEGAQGVLLDEYRGFHPYTTWSTVTAQHAWELVHQTGAEAVAVLGVTRAYTTRHGEGPLPTFCPDLTARLADPGNPPNRWQGSLRCGWLDLPLLRYAALVAGPLDGLVVNHLDQVPKTACLVCEAYRNATLSPCPAPQLSWQGELTQALGHADPVLLPGDADRIVDLLNRIAPVVLTGSGPTHEQRTSTGLRFRRRRSEGTVSEEVTDGAGAGPPSVLTGSAIMRPEWFPGRSHPRWSR